MTKVKLRFETEDESGAKMVITLEGNVTRNKVLQVLDLIELMGGLSKLETRGDLEPLTKLERIKKLILQRLPAGWFSSKDVQAEYEELYGESIRLSTVSTYLQRLYSGGFLLRSGSRAMRSYKLNKMNVSGQIP